jgi:hypothetical protein
MTDYFGLWPGLPQPASASARCWSFSKKSRRTILPPICSDGPTLDAPDCVADQNPRKGRADAKQ